MGSKLLPIEDCRQCKFRREYRDNSVPNRTIIVCRNKQLILEFEGQGGYKGIPTWCPLDSLIEEDRNLHPTSPVVALDPIPDMDTDKSMLEWAPENLTGHGGTEVDGRWYYTYDQAMAAAKELGDGWRLPTAEEFEMLCNAGSAWDSNGPDGMPGRWFGGNHDTDHKGSVFLPAAGYLHRDSGAVTYVGTEGDYWSSSPYSTDVYAGYLLFYSTGVNPVYAAYRAYGFSVRCVRQIDNSK